MKPLRALPLLALLGCPSMPFRGYEVPSLPEEAILKSVARIGTGLERGDLAVVAAVYARDLAPALCDPGRWTPAVSARGVETRRWERTGTASPLDRDGFVVEWRRYLEGFRTVARTELKPRVMDVGESSARCTVLLSVMGVDRDGRFRHDRLMLALVLRRDAAGWLAAGHQILEGDAALGRRDRFRDIARDNGTDYPHRVRDRNASQGRLHATVNADSGLAAADYDGDGWVDLFFCDGARNALLKNRGDGTFEDVTARAGLEAPPALARGALFFDADNDGDLDLYVTYERVPCRFHENLGDGTFRLVAGSGLEYAGFPSSMAVADFDRDGLLDLYLGAYGDSFNVLPQLNERNGHPNVLFRNLGGLRFADVTAEKRVGDRGWTLAVAWADYDNDGDPDLFVCNDWGASCIYRNDGARFSNVTDGSGADAAGFGMSAAFGDFDNDGDLDLYTAGMYSNAGQWLFKRREMLPVPELLAGIRDNVLGSLDTMTDGNRLLRNDGGGRFVDVARAAGVDYGQFAWCATWGDFDNDGFLDIYCANGFWSGPDTEDT